MKNDSFNITFDKKSGGIVSIVNPRDIHNMNWCADGTPWGIVRTANKYYTWEDGRKDWEDFPILESFTESDTSSTAVYSNGMLRITVRRSFKDNGNFRERYIIKNIRDTDVFLDEDNFGIVTPFNDRYASADECMIRHCNAHIWCGHSTAYVNALRMGESDMNLGLVLTKGTLDSYSIENCESNIRGDIVLNSGFFTLTPNEEHTIEWELFWHTGNDEFYSVLPQYPQSVYIKAVNHTVYIGERIEFYAVYNGDMENVAVTCNGDAVDFAMNGNRIDVSFTPDTTGEYRFDIKIGGTSTYAEFLVVNTLEAIVENRLDFIVNKQQYINPKSALHGAFLIYDNTEKHPVFDNAFGDHNACHERIGMALLLTKYLQTHENEQYRKALDLYIEFVKREFYDDETGDVYESIGKQCNRIRLYDAPWMMRLFTELYILTKDTYYTDNIVKIVRKYYHNGGSKFYPNGISHERIMRVLRESNNPDADEIFELFKIHVENIIEIGTSYPPHEVTYEQTIVTPAVNLISEMGLLTGDSRYADEAKKHIVNLERFSGHQPSFHLDEIPIRYWDAFWFGKAMQFGDTFPHYWSCLTAWAYRTYCRNSYDDKYSIAADKCQRNCLCLYSDDGKGFCAYVYPYKTNGRKGQFYDEWANDQDFALYFALS